MVKITAILLMIILIASGCSCVVPTLKGKIIFTSFYYDSVEIYVMNVDGSNQTRLTNSSLGSDYPVCSPDGTKIAFESSRDGNDEIYIMNADGSNQTRLTYNKVDDYVYAWR